MSMFIQLYDDYQPQGIIVESITPEIGEAIVSVADSGYKTCVDTVNSDLHTNFVTTYGIPTGMTEQEAIDYMDGWPNEEE